MAYRTKSVYSCKWSIDLLGGRVNGSRNCKLYLWTFTFRDVISVDEASSRWAKFQRALSRNFGFRGVRVFELHKTHGLHVHAVIKQRLDVRPIWKLAERYGFGRIDVQRVKGNPHYVAKYLGKQYREECLKGKQLWSCFGGFKGAKVKDCEIISPIKNIYQKLTIHEDFNTYGNKLAESKERLYQRWKKAEHLNFIKGFLPDDVRSITVGLC